MTYCQVFLRNVWTDCRTTLKALAGTIDFRDDIHPRDFLNTQNLLLHPEMLYKKK